MSWFILTLRPTKRHSWNRVRDKNSPIISVSDTVIKNCGGMRYKKHNYIELISVIALTHHDKHLNDLPQPRYRLLRLSFKVKNDDGHPHSSAGVSIIMLWHSLHITHFMSRHFLFHLSYNLFRALLWSSWWSKFNWTSQWTCQERSSKLSLLS